MPKNYKYIVAGSVRGLISKHYSLDAAVKSLKKDINSCHNLGGGAYSDAGIIDAKTNNHVDLEEAGYEI